MYRLFVQGVELISILAANYTHTVAVFLPLLFVLHVLIKQGRRTPGKASGVGDRKRKHSIG